MKKLIVVSILVFIALLFDLGNPDALRQGTEGFYLQVANEMFQKNSLLTPFYLGSPHWSKPPLLFILPQFFYYLDGSAGLFLSRIAVLLFSVILVGISAFKLEKICNISKSGFFLLAFSTVGFFKYSRIFMMEMPLLMCGFLSAIYFFSAIEKKERWDLTVSIIFGALCCLVKGPVSFVMLLPSFTLYSLFHYLVFKRNFIGQIVIWFASTLVLSSFWFLYEYHVFGKDFIDYFFLRENLGKFSSKSYPALHVFQGLFLYSLPWSLLIPGLIWKIYRNGVEKLSSSNSKFNVFLIISFLCFFFVWLIPQQRSHHYALPSIPFILVIIYLEYFKDKDLSGAVTKLYRSYLGFFSLAGILIVALTISLINQFPQASYVSLSIGLALLIFSIAITFRRNVKAINYFASSLIIITVFWSLFIPNYILPLVPLETRSASKDIEKIGAVHRKPYFIAQSLDREVEILNVDAVSGFLTKDSSAVIIDGPLFLLLANRSKYKILRQWKVWRRGIRGPEIFKSIKAGKIDDLRSHMYLIQRQSL